METSGRLSCYYAPFDWTNEAARIVLVGITPGFTQSMIALRKAQELLRRGVPVEQAVREAKRTGGFGGELRANLVAMLDHFELNRWLGLASCAELFTHRPELMHTTSLLRFPTFIDNRNYNGAPAVLGNPFLRDTFSKQFTAELATLQGAVFVPLGPKVSDAMAWLVSQGKLNASTILDGLPHPSGANGERINYVLGRKLRAQLSAKTDANKLDAATAKLREKIASLTLVAS